MKILVLGGTRFVGRHAVEAALAAGHAVTLFNRGKSGADLFPGVETLVGDRAGDHAALAGRTWDVVLDACAYRPAEVRGAMARLRGNAGLYQLISTVSVYKEFEQGGDESAQLWPAAADDAPFKPESYGPLKVACERALAAEWGGPSLIARPGLVAGPYDHTDRFTYWPVRRALGRRALTPALDKVVQYVDGRDLGDWLVRSAEAGLTGVMNAVGPARPFGEVFAACGGNAVPVPVTDAFLTARGVAPYSDLPLWIPGPVAGFSAAKAAAAGLRHRPVAETAADAMRWHLARGVVALKAGLSAAREKALLDEWATLA